MEELQPIETAPKNGRSVLGYWDGLSNAEPRIDFGVMRYVSGMWETRLKERGKYPPTHWTPLPRLSHELDLFTRKRVDD